tara:strand:- start:2 stop:424 length:423 start_codon:yes stop_codon:yes gene_type:complete
MADTYPTKDDYTKEVLKSDGGRKDPRTFLPPKDPSPKSPKTPSPKGPPPSDIDFDPRLNKTIRQLKKEAADRKAAKESAKKYLQKNKKSSGRGSGTAELMELHTGGRKKERIRKELNDSFIDAAQSVRNRGKTKSKKGPR